MHTNVLRVSVLRGWGWTPLSGSSQCQDKSQWAQTRSQETTSEYEGKPFYCESNRALEQAAQMCWGISFSKDILKH